MSQTAMNFEVNLSAQNHKLKYNMINYKTRNDNFMRLEYKYLDTNL